MSGLKSGPISGARTYLKGVRLLLSGIEGFADTFYEGGRVEFGAEDFVGAVGEDGYAPVADEGHRLFGLSGLDLGAEVLGTADAGFTFDVDEDEIVLAAPEHRQPFFEAEAGIYVEAGVAKDLIA